MRLTARPRGPGELNPLSWAWGQPGSSPLNSFGAAANPAEAARLCLIQVHLPAQPRRPGRTPGHHGATEPQAPRRVRPALLLQEALPA